MATAKQRLPALLATGRVANLPSITTHVGVAMMLSMLSDWGLFVGGDLQSLTFAGFILVEFLIIALLGCVFYLGGCFLGDGTDTPHDIEHHPERPIPRGVLSARAVSIAGYLAILLAWLASCLAPVIVILVVNNVTITMVVDVVTSGVILSIFSTQHLIASSLLAISVFCHAKFHRRMGTFGPILMALCRSLLIIWAAGFWDSPVPYPPSGSPFATPVIFYAGATFIYTLCLSVIARSESPPDSKPPGRISWLHVAAPPIFLVSWTAATSTVTADAAIVPALVLVVACTVFLLWSLRAVSLLGHSTSGFVSAALAGTCLMDACFGALLNWQISAACFVLFLLALGLQRFVPAT